MQSRAPYPDTVYSPQRDWLLTRFENPFPTWGGGVADAPALEPEELDTTFEQVVLVGAAVLAGAIVLSAVSGLLGFLLGLFVAA